MKRSVHNRKFIMILLLIAAELITVLSFAQSGSGGGSGSGGSGSSGSGSGSNGNAPELTFENPVLISGIANKPGAVYRFSNVTSGVDAEIRIKKFSRPQIVMSTIDLGGMGWEKAFQPQFGLPGVVQPYQNWYVDFELTFYEAGKSKKVKMSKVDMTALDVDGDGWSISEYAVFENPSSVVYSSTSYLTSQTSGAIGEIFPCGNCGVASALEACNDCGGDGLLGLILSLLLPCSTCDGTGLVQDACGHEFFGVNGQTLNGPVQNFLNIDTLATQVMATYQYTNKDRIKFRYGAKSGANSSNGSGIRLNSLWFRQFSLAPATTLPVKLSDFTARFDKKNVDLNWSGTETDFSHYVLQRSNDGKEFSDIAVIFPSEGTGLHAYNYRDANVTSPTNMVFYRLKMVDLTDETRYSEVRVIRLAGDQNALQLVTYPNPVTNQLRITIPSSWQGKPVMLELFTSSGVKIQNIMIGSASQTEEMQVDKLSKGVYLVKASCDDQVAQQRVIKK